MILEPIDKLRIKKEVAAEDEEEEPERLGMKLAVIDLEPGGDGVPIEVETHDGGPASGQQARPLLHTSCIHARSNLARLVLGRPCIVFDRVLAGLSVSSSPYP